MEKFKFLPKDKISQLPKNSGVYCFKNGKEILYIGKAANLRERVRNHFLRPAFRDNLFINQVEKVGFIKTDSEIEALILEANLIKKHQPKYNVMWRDDKNYFYIGITKENYPRVFITHQPASKFKIDHVGPFVDGRALKQALNVLRRIFPYRTCKPYLGRPCLWYQLNRCPGPCLLGSKLAMEIPGLGETIKRESQRNAGSLKKILEGGKNQSLKNLKTEMKNASKIRDFERAAKIRDQISALEKILSHSKIFDWVEPENLRKRRSPDSCVVKEHSFFSTLRFVRVWKETEKNLKKILKIKGQVKRIEAYDVSNIQGQNATGSMVIFINGQPDKNFYRRFKIKIQGKPNDVAMLKEILSRRFNHPEWGWPDLILIDGGKAHLSAALNLKSQISNLKSVSMIALAKKRSVAKPRTKLCFGAGENKLFIENQKEPILLKNLPREIFNLILQLRDEAHRFALSYHQKLREKF